MQVGEPRSQLEQNKAGASSMHWDMNDLEAEFMGSASTTTTSSRNKVTDRHKAEIGSMEREEKEQNEVNTIRGK